MIKHTEEINYDYVFKKTRKNKRKPDKTDYFIRHPGVAIATGTQGDDRPKSYIRFPDSLKPGTSEFESFRKGWVTKCDAAIAPDANLPSFNPATVGHLIALYIGDELQEIPPHDLWSELKPATQIGYRPILEDVKIRWGQNEVRLLDTEMAAKLRDTINGKSGPRMANQYLSVLRNLEKVSAEKRTTFELPAGFSFATGIRRYGVRSGIKPRKQYWSYEQEKTFIETALQGVPGELEPNVMIYRGFMMMAYLGQRLTDVIEMTVDQFDGTHVALKQSKTGQQVNVKVHEDLLPILLKAKQEANQAGVLRAPIIHGDDWKRFSRDYFSKRWDLVARQAGVYRVLQRRDLRRTAVVRLDQMGTSTGHIASVTGHSEASIQSIIETYRVRTTESADQAIAQLEQFTRGKKRAGDENV